MSRESRSQILGQLESELQAPVLSFVTGDRPGLATQIASDQLILFPRHLSSLGHNEVLNLLLYTRGGETTAAWPIIGFLREHAQKIRVLVPFYAHSAGTLIALGADEVIMARYATLSPIDPSVANAFNPQDPANPANKLQIAVEDVLAYLQLAAGNGSSDHQVRADAFKRLAESVHPLALGNVQRSINQIKQLAHKMLALHDSKDSQERTDAIVNALTTQLYSHLHLVNRREAIEIGLPVIPAEDKVDELLCKYYQQICADLELRSKFDPARIYQAALAASSPAVGASPVVGAVPLPAGATRGQAATQTLSVPARAERAYIETTQTCDAYVAEGTITQVVTPQQAMPGVPGQIQITPGQLAIQFQVTTDEWHQVD
jgi:Serine dehydrogenase proteinase